jgi:thiamine monophosphate kinase
VADASHLAAAGRVRIVLDLDLLPVLAGASVDDAARSGEEYELLVTAPASLDAATFEQRFGLLISRIGTVEERAPGVALLETRRRGERVEPPRGHDHLSRS